MRIASKPRVSVVIPVFNEAANLPELMERCLRTLRSMDLPFELILVDDGSLDSSASLIERAAETNPGEITGILLNRNYGQHAAVMAGFEAATGDIVVTLDGDLQNPPEEIPHLVAAVMDGVGEPGLIVDGAASGHTFTMRPSMTLVESASTMELRGSPV